MLGMPATAHALGFGALQLSSYLHQELNAEVPLLLNSSDDVDAVQVQLAGQHEYRKVKLPWQPELASVTVVLEGKHSAHPRIVLHSIGAIDSPLLSILLKASKAGHGTYFKHFQLFLDPPETPAGQPQPEVIPLREGSSVSSMESAEIQPEVPDLEWARTRRYGPVRSGDSLSEIAFRLRRDKRFSNRQVMLSLYETNPHAFVGGDINQLKRGTWLDVPEGEVVKTYASAASMRRLSVLLQSRAKAQAAASAPKEHAARPVATTAVASRSEQELRYSGSISVNAATARKHEDAQVSDHTAAQFKAIHAELMAGKLRMSDLGQSVADINHAVAGIRQDMESLKQDVATIKTQTRQLQPAAGPANIWMVTLMALVAGMLGALLVIGLRKRGEPVSSIADEGALGAATPMPSEGRDTRPVKTVADEVVQLLNRAEEQLGACEFEQTAQTLDQIDGLNPDSVRAAVLRAQLYHETGQVEARNALINGISESADKRRWEKFCSLLPSHVWNACFNGEPGADEQPA